MKKFLPLVFFILAFSGFIAAQVGWQSLFAETTKKDSRFASYEEMFLKGQFDSVEGKKIDVAKLKSPVVIYNFWASWCNPCIEEIPSLMNLKKKFTDSEVQVLAFNTDEEEQLKNIQKIKKKLKITNEFIIIPDKNTKIAESFNISAIPVTIIFSHGKVVHFSNGPMDFNSQEIIEKMKKWIKD